MALEVDVKSHARNLSVTLDRIAIEMSVNVFPFHAGVGIEVPVECEREVGEFATGDVVVVEIDVRQPRGNFPRSFAGLDRSLFRFDMKKSFQTASRGP